MSNVEVVVDHNIEISEKILKFCHRKNRYLHEISNYVGMNKNEVRSLYLYPLIRVEKMIMINTKFRSK